MKSPSVNTWLKLENGLSAMTCFIRICKHSNLLFEFEFPCGRWRFTNKYLSFLNSKFNVMNALLGINPIAPKKECLILILKNSSDISFLAQIIICKAFKEVSLIMEKFFFNLLFNNYHHERFLLQKNDFIMVFSHSYVPIQIMSASLKITCCSRFR